MIFLRCTSRVWQGLSTIGKMTSICKPMIIKSEEDLDADDIVAQTRRKRRENKQLKCSTTFLPRKTSIRSLKTSLPEKDIHESLGENSASSNAFMDDEAERANLAEDLKICSVVPDSDINKLVDMIAEFRHSVEQRLAEISAKQDRIERIVQNSSGEFQESVVEDQTIRIFPLDSVEDVFVFEDNLNNDEYRHKVVGHLRRITGSGQPWKTASYKLCSTLFTKKLLTLYSWTGASRTDFPKQSFKNLANILDVFFQVVYYADNRFSHIHKEEFFKDCVLKHSKSRLNSKRALRINEDKTQENDKDMEEARSDMRGENENREDN